VVLHTNLGRAPLGREAARNVAEIAAGYVNLEIDLESGTRGSRYGHVEGLLRALTGAEAALVVNNNAAAVLLALNTLASGRQVVVSRGQLVEIGGAFRIPEVMRCSGAVMVEVGTTNKTYRSDYEQAIGPETALLLSVHPSNYRIVGFTSSVPLAELVEVGRAYDIPTMEDMGSGVLVDLSPWGLSAEPTVQERLRQGVDVLTFSGDKLLGGPQAGIIVGRRDLVERMKRNQLTRALRVDKITIAALEGTLLEYLRGSAMEAVPSLAMVTASRDTLLQRAQTLAAALQARCLPEDIVESVGTVAVEDLVGGGAFPTDVLPGAAVEMRFCGERVHEAACRLRTGVPAVLPRVSENRMLLSLRTIRPAEEHVLVERIDRTVRGLSE
jgi:L-seryl-tRNA(Ser) seleniumtransferase